MLATVDGVALSPPAPGRNLPPRAFTSHAVFELEQRAVFARSWVHVADAIDLAHPGAYVAASIGATPILVVRDRTTKVLRAFLNACRHRGTQLLEGRGTCDKQIKCPYHAWSYGHDGSLLGVPFREEFSSCDTAAMGLVPIRVGVVGPLVFACLDPQAPALVDWVGQLPGALAALGVERWDLAFELEYELDANWKLFVENANDGYHIPFVHDLLTDILVEASGVTTLEPHSAFTLADINPNYIPPDAPLAAADAKIRFGCVFPNLIPVLSPADFTYIRIDPVSADRLKLFVRSYDTPESAPLRELRKLAFERTTDQDLAVVRRTMKGLRAVGLPAGVHAATLEERIGHFERTWAAQMSRQVAGEQLVS